MGLIRRSKPALEFYIDEAAILSAKAAAVPVVLTSLYLITLVSLIGVYFFELPARAQPKVFTHRTLQASALF